MNRSDQIDQIATALAKAQGDNNLVEESKILKDFFWKSKGKNAHSKSKMPGWFFEKIAYGASGCWNWIASRTTQGYGMHGRVNGEVRAHRLSWTLFHGEIPEKSCVLHKCDNPSCVNPSHLFLGTQQDNIRDMCNKNRNDSSNLVHGFGEKNLVHKLTEEKVMKAREERKKTGLSYKILGKKYGVSTMTMFRAITKQAWSHI